MASRNDTGDDAPARIGIVTVSDRASRGEYVDRGGPAIRDYLAEVLTSPWAPCVRVVEDEVERIEAALRELCDDEGCCLVVTTGGTGPALRDVTPEATLAVCEKPMPGFGELMRQVSLKAVPTAILSRQTAGIRGSSPDRQPAGPAEGDRRVSGRGVPGHPVLRGSDRWALPDDGRNADRRVSAAAGEEELRRRAMAKQGTKRVAWPVLAAPLFHPSAR